jgi:fructokinase
MGHMFIPRSPDDAFEGNCPFHQACLEGLASGSAINRRIQGEGVSISDKDSFWELETQYLALGIVNIICILSPERIILGGGVFEKRDFLFPMIRKKVQVLLNSYIQMKEIVEDINQYIVSPALGSQSGILGALALAYG